MLTSRRAFLFKDSLYIKRLVMHPTPPAPNITVPKRDKRYTPKLSHSNPSIQMERIATEATHTAPANKTRAKKN